MIIAPSGDQVDVHEPRPPSGLAMFARCGRQHPEKLVGELAPRRYTPSAATALNGRTRGHRPTRVTDSLLARSRA